MRTVFDAIVVGAGPAGSAVAILLARAGWAVALVEKQHYPRRKVCGECVAASNFPLLEALGVGPAFSVHAGPCLEQVALMRGDLQIVAPLPAAENDRGRWGRALGRESLDAMLLAQAKSAGVSVLQPWAVQTLAGQPGAWQCDLREIDSREMRQLHAPVVIDAHGSWEAALQGDAAASPARSARDLIAFKANFRDARSARGVLPVLSFPGGYGGMVLADQGRTTLACCIRRDRLDALRSAAPGERAGAVIEAMLMRECTGVRVALQAATRLGPWLAAGPIRPGVRLHSVGGPFRVGNAAGEAHPILGEGISMALQSAFLLCLNLLSAAAGSDLSDAAWQRRAGKRYATEWRRHFVPRLRVAALFANLAMRPAGSEPWMALARRWPGLLTLGARWGGKVSCAVDAGTISFLSRTAVPTFQPFIRSGVTANSGRI